MLQICRAFKISVESLYTLVLSPIAKNQRIEWWGSNQICSTPYTINYIIVANFSANKPLINEQKIQGIKLILMTDSCIWGEHNL